MELITNYFDLEKETNENQVKLYEECNDLLNKIYSEYTDTQIIEQEEKNLLEKFIPHYTTNIEYMGLFFSVDFILCHKRNSEIPKTKKKIKNEFEEVKLRFPKMYEYVKNDFLKKVSGLTELRKRNDTNIKYNNLMTQMKLTYKNKDTYVTNLYKWYWNNVLLNLLEIADLLLLLSQNNIFIETIEKALNSIYLFSDYNINFIPDKIDIFEFENNDYIIKFKPYNMYPNGYTPKYIFKIIDKKTNENFSTTKFTHHLRMFIDDIFNNIISFINIHSTKIHFK